MEFIIRQTVDLARENSVLHYAQALEYGDACAHRWMVTINGNGEQADLSAMSAKCYVTRAASDAERAQGVTSVTVMLDAEIDAKAGTVSCVFDAACYGGVGAATAILRLIDASGATVTAARLTARLNRSTSDAVYDPEGLVPSMDALLAQIDAMEAATAAAKTATQSANTATGKANTATTNANNAANNANTQAEAAKSAAEAANAAAKSWGDSTAANSEKLGGKAPEYYIQPRNLLDNSDWQSQSRIVNQRGATNYTGSGYTIDRWTIGSGTLEVHNTYMTLVADDSTACVLKQFLEDLPDGTYTFAAYASGYIRTRVLSVSEGTVTTIDNSNAAYTGGYLTLEKGTSNYFVTIRANAGYRISVRWAALYEGSYTADTLPPYVPKGYAQELAECQRYCKKLNQSLMFRSSVISANTVQTLIPLPDPMRIIPSIESGDFVITNTLGIVQSGFTFSVSVNGNGYLRIDAAQTSHGLTDACLRCNSNVILSADL